MATFEDSNIEQLHELLICAICLDYYKDPRLLACSHTFCLKCINQIVKNGKAECPFRDTTTIDQKDIDKLPINRTAKDMVEFVLSMNLSTGKKNSHPCDNCSENQAVGWCDKCTAHYCESCTKSVHSLKALQSHTVVPLSDKIQPFCMDHSDEKFKYWCSQCEILVCRDCLLFKHKDHVFMPLKDAAAEAKTKFREAIQQTLEIKENLTKFSDTTKGITNKQHEKTHQQKQHIEQTFADLQRKLNERKCVILKQLEDQELQTMSILDQQQNTIDQHLNLTTVQELCTKKMLESNDPMQILKFKSALSGNYKDFTEQYKKIDEGFVIICHTFTKDDKDTEQISEEISKLGCFNSESHVVTRDGIRPKISSLDISKPDGETKLTLGHETSSRGYKLLLKNPSNLQSIQIHSDHVGQVTGFVVNGTGVIIQKGTVNSTDKPRKWLTIPIECVIQNNYTVFVRPSSGNGSFTYKLGDTQLRTINQNCSVESKHASPVPQINVGSQMAVNNNSYSIDMILGIQE